MLWFVAQFAAVISVGVGGIHGTEISNSDFIRSKCPLHLVSPDWVITDAEIINWFEAETSARFNLVNVVWLFGVVVIIVWHFHPARIKT